MTEREALHRAVCANPDDDVPRLVFADWLQDNGEPDRGAFIRAQVEFAARLRQGLEELQPQPFRAFGDSELNRQQELNEIRQFDRELWTTHFANWRTELPRIEGVQWFSEFHRGFVERVTVASDSILVENVDRIFYSAPVQHLVLNDFQGARGFSSIDALAHLRTLHVRAAIWTTEAVEEFLRCEHFAETLLITFPNGAGAQRIYEKFKNFHWSGFSPPPEPQPPGRRRRRGR